MRSYELRGLTASLRSWKQPLLLIGICLCATAVNATAVLQELRVRRFASFVEAPVSDNDQGVQRSRIQIMGRTMTLVLQNNTELTAPVPGIELQRGVVEDTPGSWLRLTRSNQGVNGLIWDGQELYVVTPSRALPQAAATRGNVVYKLSEARTGLPAAYCGANSAEVDQPTTGLAQYQALQQELIESAPPADVATAVTLRLELQLLADTAFQEQFAADDEVRAALLARLNNVDGIFSSQLGLSVQAADIQLLNAQTSQSLGGTDAGTLLHTLAHLRDNSPVMGTYPVTHLVTGRDLNGDTLGISYINQLCGAKYAVSLSESHPDSVWIDSLVLAHELGHQLGAVHDGYGSCASTDANRYLMSANISGTSELSACSRQVMLHTMSHTACLVPSSLPTVQPTTSPTSASRDPGNGGGGALTTLMLTLLGWLCLMRGRLQLARLN